MISYIDYKQAPIEYNGKIRIFDKDALVSMRKVCKLTAQCLDDLVDIVRPGMSAKEIDDFVVSFSEKYGATPASLNYRGYPYSCCISVNHVVCHGMPLKEKYLNEGDIVNIDVTFILNGWYGDSSRMFPIGKIKKSSGRLLNIAHQCLMNSIASISEGVLTGFIGFQIQNYAKKERCSVVKDFCGHGIGQIFHDAPNILHYGNPEEGIPLREGMIFTVEPMINLGKEDVKILNDGWTAVTKDRSLSAQYEHTIVVLKNGCEILTSSPNNTFFIPYSS